MDDPWANAWGEPPKITLPDSAASSSWTAPSVSVIQGDHEDDLAMPSWSSGPNAGWTEPDIPETSLWGGDSIAGGWNPAPSSFDRMSLASKESDANDESDTHRDPRRSPTNHEPQDSPGSPPQDEDEGDWKVPTIQADAASPTRSPPGSPIKVTPLSLPSANGVNDFGSGGWDPAPTEHTEPSDESPALGNPSLSAKARPLSSVPDDVDGFGVFETAHEVDDADGWGTPSRATFIAPSGDPWATAEPWGSSSSAHAQEDTSEDDEWEAARQQKAKQDLHVPPELLASILRQFDDLAVDMWPNKEEGQGGLERRVDFESIGLESIISRLIPQDLTLSQNVSFPKTFTSKQVVEALKLTRHSTVTRSSPIAFYMASKGSLSWEAALKSKPLVPQEDITPAGWKIVAQEKVDSVPTEDTKKKPSGGLLSFFQRKPTVSSVSEEPKQQESASSTGTPRASVDSTRSSATQSQVAAKSTPSSPSVVSFASSLDPISETTVAKPVTPSPIPDFSADSIIQIETVPAPSAVSRFLGRFSGRTRTTSNPSMALSSDDLEFLADVPTAASGDTISEFDTDSLSAMIRSPALPTKLPAPLAPPPRAPPQPTRVLSPPPPPKPQPAQTDDFMSFFDALPSTSTQIPAPSSSESPLSLLAPSPPPPAKSDRAQSLSSLQAFVAPSPPPAPSVQELRSFSIDERAATPKNDNADTDSWPSFNYPVAPSPKSASPRVATPSQPAKRPFVAVMASSSRPPSAPATPPLLPKPGSGFTFPAPPSIQRPATKSPPVSSSPRGSSPFPAPPSSRGQTSVSIQSTQPSRPSVSVHDDDDFADFLSSPAQATPPPSDAFQSFASASTTAPVLPPSQLIKSANLSNSFDDFVDSLPPIPPAKNFPTTSFRTSSPALAPPPSVSNRKPTTISPPPPPSHAPSGSVSQKPSRKADHSRTLSLLETAAARGRWLAPPSPLPEALPPPTLSGRNNTGHDASVDYLGGMLGTGGDGGLGEGASSMQAAQAAATHAMGGISTGALRPDPSSNPNGNGNSMSKASVETPSWTFPPPSGFGLKLAPPPAPSSFASGASLKPTNSNANGISLSLAFPSSGTPPPSNKGKPMGTGQTGGLSAQDLSFFEGL